MLSIDVELTEHLLDHVMCVLVGNVGDDSRMTPHIGKSSLANVNSDLLALTGRGIRGTA